MTTKRNMMVVGLFDWKSEGGDNIVASEQRVVEELFHKSKTCCPVSTLGAVKVRQKQTG